MIMNSTLSLSSVKLVLWYMELYASGSRLSRTRVRDLALRAVERSYSCDDAHAPVY